MSLKLSEGPAAIQHQAVKQFPELKKPIQRIIQNYILIRYASQADSQLIKKFITQVQQFKP